MAGKYVYPLLTSRLQFYANGIRTNIYGSTPAARAVLQQMIFGTAAAGGIDVTGTGALTQDVEIFSGSGNYLGPITGTSAISQVIEALAASGTYLGPISGTGAIAQAVEALVASGVFIGPITATGDLIQSIEELAASGTYTPPAADASIINPYPYIFHGKGRMP